MGESKFLYRPATKALRSHVEAARLDYEPKVRLLSGSGIVTAVQP